MSEKAWETILGIKYCMGHFFQKTRKNGFLHCREKLSICCSFCSHKECKGRCPGSAKETCYGMVSLKILQKAWSKLKGSERKDWTAFALTVEVLRRVEK